MKVIIAGSRHITDFEELIRAVSDSQWAITEVVCGMAPGVDRMGLKWAAITDAELSAFPADWSRGKCAGPERNERMAAYADALIAIWDGKSRGTADMIKRAQAHGLPVFIRTVRPPEER